MTVRILQPALTLHQPLAATFFPSESSPPLRDPEIAAPSPRPSTPARTGFPTFLPRRRQPSTSPSAVFTTPPPQPAEPGRLQVAVAVSMPAHREYCLGLVKVPWHVERNAAGQPEAGSS
ncbi:hypothetical protein A0H81_12200 [Grifola frondosa]|uniref:Uncharacterized protein n=1 Tax=Grifola frondosa TaxID=5627 RepID=A0A1C7LST3_GRIFR|nr:hypothetical protein A0H81_12200 [Grifola frondosa]